MRFTRKYPILAVLVALSALAAVSAFAFVPSCEEELAAAYPPALKADLSACDVQEVVIAADPGIDAGEFGAALTGSWLLRSRTAHGITVNDESRAGHLYFDLERQGDDRLAGSALLLDRPKNSGDVLPSSQSVAAFWGLTVVSQGDDHLVLSMTGDSLGSYSHVHVADSAGFDFVQHKGAFVSRPDGDQRTPAWDRVVVMEGSLTFVSCELGLVERYIKTSSQSPTVEGASLEEYWQQLRTDGRVAAAQWPASDWPAVAVAGP